MLLSALGIVPDLGNGTVAEYLQLLTDEVLAAAWTYTLFHTLQLQVGTVKSGHPEA